MFVTLKAVELFEKRQQRLQMHESCLHCLKYSTTTYLVQIIYVLKCILLYIGFTISIFLGYKHAANSCFLCFSYVISTDNRFCICRIDVIPTDNSFMRAEVTSPNTLTSSLISFVVAELSSGICIIKQLLDSFFT